LNCHPIHPTIDLIGFLTLGLLGSFGHCVGMCSPFVLFVSRQYSNRAAGRSERGRAFAAQAWYTGGRIVTYAVLGALAGALGSAVELAGALVGLQRAASLVAGGVLVAWALVALSDLGPLRKLSVGAPVSHVRRVAATVGQALPARLLKGRVPGHPFATGVFLGLLPCGLLYSAVIAAVARGNALDGAAALAFFGLGTAPALLGISLADELLARRRMLLNRLSQVFILVMGTWFLWRGFAR
jgi:sulfite exporter TauE/SafE